MGLHYSSSWYGSTTDFLLVLTISPRAFVPLAHRLCPEPFRYCPRVWSILTQCLLLPWTLAEKTGAMVWENRRMQMDDEMMRRWRPLAGASVAWWEWLALEIWVLDLVVLHDQKKSILEELKIPITCSLLYGLLYRLESWFGQGRQFILLLAFQQQKISVRIWFAPKLRLLWLRRWWTLCWLSCWW